MKDGLCQNNIEHKYLSDDYLPSLLLINAFPLIKAGCDTSEISVSQPVDEPDNIHSSLQVYPQHTI